MRVFGTGSTRHRRAIVGEGPGWQENNAGSPFVGKTGDELDHHLEINGLPNRRQWWLDNIFDTYQGKDYEWTPDDLVASEPRLAAALAKVRPRLIVTLGRYATRYFLGDVDMDSTEMIPWYLPATFDRSLHPWATDDTVIFPIVHPAAGMHNPEMSPHVVAGFQELRRFLDGDLLPRFLFDDPIPDPRYEEITTEGRLDRVCAGLTRASHVAIDTEGWPWNPWSLQFCFEEGTGFVVRKGATALLQRFVAHLRRSGAGVVFHSALHDLGMQRPLEIELGGIRFDDTMIMAYLLQIVPKGLKQACLRECGMKMDDFADLVEGPSTQLAIDYLMWLWDIEETDYKARCLREFERRRDETWVDKKGKTRVGRRITKIPSLPKTQLHKAIGRCLQSRRPRGLWEDQIEDVQVAAYKRLKCEMPEATLDYVEEDRAINYGARDSDGTRRLLDVYSRRIDAMGLRDVYELELGTYPLLNRMQQIGMKPDLEHFSDLSKILELELGRVQARIAQTTGRQDFNVNSGDQVAAYLFGTLGFDEIKMTSSGRGSTNDKILEALEHEHPELPIVWTRQTAKGPEHLNIIGLMRYFRATYKLKNTFVDRLPDFVHRWPFDGRIHTSLRTTSVVTGRLAASDPNVLAQPEHGEWAPDFKRGWVCEDGHILWAGDQSQIELRGLAHLSQDPTLLAIYRGEIRNPDGSEIDLHAKTAHRIFGGNIAHYMHKCNERLAAKAVNFGLPMGMQAQGLSVELRKNGIDADVDTAQRWIDETDGLYPGVVEYKKQCIAEAEHNGYIRCLSGRIRYIGGIRSREERIRAEAERFSFSTKIQESATLVMKLAEVVVWRDVLPHFWKRNIYCEPLIQIHDCLKGEINAGYEKEFDTAMRHAMTNVVWRGKPVFSVPLVVESEIGPNMADMKGL